MTLIINSNLQTPEHITIENQEFIIPDGFSVASIENLSEELPLLLRNANGKTVTITAGSAFCYDFIGKIRTAVTVVALGAGCKAQIVYEF
ncbi:hypothetical protein Q0590_25085 [Rhodocytophaga aerolata]|uniref:Uncharacterized protein n=1 Tax=Rhodocytophaga aerolata TaxID=455078 RepID=A0ABT8RCZ8_9BACT|nr:hypothetical protein [Rhodocytophaga aerolata]MDO1449576.1 hypothetical protein [Rhodocytophaga aerolata]